MNYSWIGTVFVLRNQGNGTFAQPVEYAVGGQLRKVVAGDITGDGKVDLAVLRVKDDTYAQDALIVLNNNGTGAFSVSAQHTLPYAYGVDIADLNGDGRADVVTNLGSAAGVHLSQANGTLAARVDYPVAISISGDVARVGDVNGDGKPDVVAFAQDATYIRLSQMNVLLNAGSGTFGAAQSSSSVDIAVPSSMALADINGDGTLDVVSRSGGIGIALGKGNGTFAAATYYAQSDGDSRGLVVGDLTGDGKPEIVSVSSSLNAVIVGKNECP
jgi:hypothetical protein